MINADYNSKFENIDNVKNYENILKQYIDKQAGLIENFKTSYVLFNKDNTYNEYQQLYSTSKKNLDDNSASMFTTINELQNNINKLEKNISLITGQINTNLTNNIKMGDTLDSSEGTNNSAKIMIDNSKELYKDQYINNITKVLGIFILIFLTFIKSK